MVAMGTRDFRKYEINIFNLSNKEHTYKFEFDRNLFQMFQQDIVKEGNGTCHIVINKSDTMLNMCLRIEAHISLTCDISLKIFRKPLNISENIIIKFSDEETELDENIKIIKWDTETINIAFYIYELVLLSVPMKKIHPEIDQPHRPTVIFDKSNKNVEVCADPRWEILKKLK